MKKNLFFLFALICSVSLFTACSDDDDNKGGKDENVHPNVGTYSLAGYETATISEKPNIPTEGALYFDWQLKDNKQDGFVSNFANLARYMGGSVLPQVLNAITLDNEGNVLANYVEKPAVKMADMNTIMGMFLGMSPYPTKDEVKANFATSGFTSSDKGLATWTESNGHFVLKLNIAAIVASELDGDAAQFQEIIDQVLNSTPAEFKQLLGGLLKVDLSKVRDASIQQLLDWAKNGIPMNLITKENGHTVISLEKKALDTFIAMYETGETDEFGQFESTNDLTVVWNALLAAKIIPEDAQNAGMIIGILGQYWDKTSVFDLGFDLVKE